MASEKITAIVEEIKGLTILELNELSRLSRRSSAFPLPLPLLLPAAPLPLLLLPLRRRPSLTLF